MNHEPIRQPARPACHPSPVLAGQWGVLPRSGQPPPPQSSSLSDPQPVEAAMGRVTLRSFACHLQGTRALDAPQQGPSLTPTPSSPH